MTTSNGEQEAVRLERAVDAFVQRVQTLPKELLTRAPAPGEWSVAELAAHSAEIYPYWAKQISYLRGNPGSPFGRTASDSERIGFIERHKGDPIESLLAAIKNGAAEAAAALYAFSDDEWRTVTGLHSARGEMDMDYISNLFLAGHAEEHLEQLDETLAALDATAPQA